MRIFLKFTFQFSCLSIAYAFPDLPNCWFMLKGLKRIKILWFQSPSSLVLYQSAVRQDSQLQFSDIYRHTDTLVYRHTDTLIFRHTDTMVYWYTDTLVYKHNKNQKKDARTKTKHPNIIQLFLNFFYNFYSSPTCLLKMF